MSDESALLAAILAHPDEDTPRLMYADWLQENGQPERAEFIRLQCAVDLDDDSKGRMFELEQWYRSKWLTGLQSDSGMNWEFRRGFPEELCLHFGTFLREYETLVGTDWPRRLSLLEVPQRITRFSLNQEWNPRWVELELQASAWFSGYVLEVTSIHTVFAIANCPQATQLRQLRFSQFELTEDVIQELAVSRYLNNLRQLRLDGSPYYPGLATLRDRFGERLVIG